MTNRTGGVVRRAGRPVVSSDLSNAKHLGQPACVFDIGHDYVIEPGL